MTSKARITKRVVDGLDALSRAEDRVWDTEIKGFCVRVYTNGRKVYAVKYRVHGRQRWFTIGAHGSPWTPEEAREEAKRVLRRAAEGQDPQQDKVDRRQDLTVAELIDLYLEEGPRAKPDKRSSTWDIDRSNLTRHLKPLLGQRIARSVSTTDIGRAISDVTQGRTKTDIKTKARGRAIVKGGAGTAARVLSTTGAMFAWAAQQGLVSAVPTVGVRLPKRPARERFLRTGEARALLKVIDDLQANKAIPRSHADIFRLLLLTGARKTEIAGLRWTEVDLASGRLSLPPERTKAGGRTGQRRITLSGAAQTILTAIPRGVSPFVFPSSLSPDKPVSGLRRSWGKVRKATTFNSLRIHDLRHSYASMAIEGGASLAVVGKALGHSGLRVTERYAHLTEDPVAALSSRIADALTAGSAPEAANEETGAAA